MSGLVVRGLDLFFKNTPLLKNISLTLPAGTNLALIGRSGAGKSLLGRSLVRLLGPGYELRAEELSFAGQKILVAGPSALRQIRRELALVPQEAQLSLYPYLDLGALTQILLKTHTSLNATARREAAFGLFERLGFEDVELLWHSYPHELSLGMARRVCLALALLGRPRVLICDEPTASLDRENAEKLTHILASLRGQTSLILITHDLALLPRLAERVGVLEGGRLEFEGSLRDFEGSNNEWGELYRGLYA